MLQGSAATYVSCKSFVESADKQFNLHVATREPWFFLGVHWQHVFLRSALSRTRPRETVWTQFSNTRSFGILPNPLRFLVCGGDNCSSKRNCLVISIINMTGLPWTLFLSCVMSVWRSPAEASTCQQLEATIPSVQTSGNLSGSSAVVEGWCSLGTGLAFVRGC